jgi:uncharacterized protein
MDNLFALDYAFSIICYNFTLKKNEIMKKLIISIACIFLLTCSLWALNPSRQYKYTPADFGMDYKEVKIQTADNMKLHGWFFNATETGSKKVIILSDDGDGNMADMLKIASNFLTLGYNVLTYDYRGYGESDPFTINQKFFIYNQFESDLQAAVDFVRKYYATLKTVHLYGQGIGASLSICVGVDRLEISKVIADSPYSTLAAITKRYEEFSGMAPEIPMVYDKKKMEPKHALESGKKGLNGILFIAGEYDDIYTVDDCKELMKIRRNISQLHVVKGAESINTFSTDEEGYFAAIKKFL